ncbi:hypothetical protein PR048_004895 [Dryococelus australis]|uniref:Secreted protein n=1 Tax=Dryococelus australis TaxID=614101 RepID=A0ABQ9I7U5_9NEOP|nr:hypothetical protein PR048_004895 [Dryococelus australis]
MLLQPYRAIIILMTVAYLHNFLRRNHTSRNLYTLPGTFDHEDDEGEFVKGTWRSENNYDMQSLLPIKVVPRRPTQKATDVLNTVRLVRAHSRTGIHWANHTAHEQNEPSAHERMLKRVPTLRRTTVARSRAEYRTMKYPSAQVRPENLRVTGHKLILSR